MQRHYFADKVLYSQSYVFFSSSYVWGFPCGSAGKQSTCNVGDLGWILELGRYLEKVKASHSSILAWRIPWTIGITKSQTRLSDFHFHVWLWELDHKEGWILKNWCFWTMVLEKTLESPLDCKVTKPVNPKGNQPWIFIERTDAKAEGPILWPLDDKSWLIGKDLDAGKDWRQEEKGMTKDKMVAWHHWFNGHEFEQILGDGEGQRSLACCSPWGHNELDTTEQLKWTSNLFISLADLVHI